MARRPYSPKTDLTPSLLKFREKRKWQINLRRYVIDRTPCPAYAPYFGLDNTNLRLWFEMQFTEGLSWENFGREWQFDHLIPVAYFDYSINEELKLCWNFTNLRVEPFQLNKNRGHRLDVLAAKSYFEELYNETQYNMCIKLLRKIEGLKLSSLISTDQQKRFIKEKRPFLEAIENYSVFEFELLNRGRSIAEVEKEIAFLKKFEK
jgi:hypothetical protein